MAANYATFFASATGDSRVGQNKHLAECVRIWERFAHAGRQPYRDDCLFLVWGDRRVCRTLVASMLDAIKKKCYCVPVSIGGTGQSQT